MELIVCPIVRLSSGCKVMKNCEKCFVVNLWTVQFRFGLNLGGNSDAPVPLGRSLTTPAVLLVRVVLLAKRAPI